MNRAFPEIAPKKLAPLRPNRHQFVRLCRSFEAKRSGRTLKRTCSKGRSKRAASASERSPKLITQECRGRVVKSFPLRKGRRTSRLRLPFGLEGAESQVDATSWLTSNSPTSTGPWKLTPLFSNSCATSAKLVWPFCPSKSAWTIATDCPSNVASPPFSPSKHTIDTRTAAPSTVQPSSDHASKIRPPSTMGFSTARLAPPRMELVATRPARERWPACICSHAFANQ